MNARSLTAVTVVGLLLATGAVGTASAADAFPPIVAGPGTPGAVVDPAVDADLPNPSAFDDVPVPELPAPDQGGVPPVADPGVPTLSAAEPGPVENSGSSAVVRDDNGELQVRTSSDETPDQLSDRLADAGEQVVASDETVRRYATSAPAQEDAGRDLQWALTKLQAEDIWQRSTGAGVTVAVLDSGVKASHPDLRGRVAGGFNAITGKPGGRTDDFGHGTFIAGLIAGSRNGAGIVGFAPSARIMPVKVLDADGVGESADIAAGIIWAAENGADVINMSFGSDSRNAVEAQAVDYARRLGVLLVGAGGNDGAPLELYPAAYPGVIGVGATDYTDRRSSFSNRGNHIDVVAPGQGILSAYGTSPSYLWTSGTSMSTAYVSGLAALAMSFGPGSGGDPLAEAIQASARDLGSPGRDREYGAGIIDPAALIEQMGGGRAPGMPTDLIASGSPEGTLRVSFTPPPGSTVRVRLKAGAKAPGWYTSGRGVYEGAGTGSPVTVDVPNQKVGKRYAFGVFTTGPTGTSRAVATVRPLAWRITPTTSVKRQSRPRITAGAKVNSFGWLGGFPLQLDSQQGGGRQDARRFVPNGFGPNSFAVRPLTWSFHYRFTFLAPGFWNSASSQGAQYVQTTITAKRGARITGRITPNKKRSTVELQRRAGGGWRTVKTTRSAPNGRFSLPSVSGTLRVYAPADLWHGPATATL